MSNEGKLPVWLRRNDVLWFRGSGGSGVYERLNAACRAALDAEVQRKPPGKPISRAECRREVVECCRAMKRVASAYARYWKDSNYQDQLTDAVNALRVESSKAKHFLTEKGEGDGD